MKPALSYIYIRGPTKIFFQGGIVGSIDAICERRPLFLAKLDFPCAVAPQPHHKQQPRQLDD